MQALDSKSLNAALEKWFSGLDVDRDGLYNISVIVLSAFSWWTWWLFFQNLWHLLNFKPAWPLELTLILGDGLNRAIRNPCSWNPNLAIVFIHTTVTWCNNLDSSLLRYAKPFLTTNSRRTKCTEQCWKTTTTTSSLTPGFKLFLCGPAWFEWRP